MEPPGGRRVDDVVDAMIALACAVFAVVTVTSPVAAAPYDFPHADWRLVALAVGSASVLAARRRWPLIVCGIVCTAVFTIGALRWNAGSTPAFVLIALYTVGAGRAFRSAVAGLVLAYVGAAILIGLHAPYFDHPIVAVFVLALTAAWSLGRWVRHRREQRAAALALALDAEHASASHAARAVLTERIHIARELHDVVSHTLTVIAVQSGSARHQLAGRVDPRDRDLVALSAIETSSHLALDDLRRLLGVLRAEAPVGDPGRPELVGSQPPVRATPRVLEDWVDAAVAATLGALGIGLAFVDDPSSGFRFPSPNALLVILTLLASLPLAVRRRQPIPVYVVCAVSWVVIGALGWDPDWPGLAVYVALYTVAAWRAPWVSGACWLACVAGEAVLWAQPPPHSDAFASVPGVQSLVALLLGLAVRRWRQQRDEAIARAFETQRGQAASAARAAFAERLRIAAEMHDVVSHTLSAIAVQSAVLRHRLGPSDGVSDAAVVAIDQASRSALEDLRRMLDVFRDTDGGSVASLSPTPGLAELNLLVSAHRAAHGPIEFDLGSGLFALPDSVQLAMFRLVQEALTNVRKHAAGAATRVRIDTDEGAVVVHVDNDGSGGPFVGGTSRGFGLVGMRERVEMFRGSLDAGPLPGGGFRIEARLPIGSA